MDLNGSVVLVTGANGGLGREFVRQSLERGAAKVYAAARRPNEWSDRRIVPLRLDVTDPASVHEAAASAADVTVLVNNAGITGASSLLSSPIGEIRDVFETNVFGPLELVREFAPALACARRWIGRQRALRVELARDARGVQLVEGSVLGRDECSASGAGDP
ncbi:MAG: hypothetical protein QOE89_465, partial [Pseudonocardiales bacterium]|nr:hypothetical protein [Pseudonocardiales bacterium]